MAQATSIMRVGDLVDVRPQPTVVRLDDLDAADAAWISESYCITEDVRRHLDVLRNVLARPTGCGMFVVGQYGSGKSHLLAYVARELGSLTKRPIEAVPVSLLNHRAELRLEDIVGEALGLDLAVTDRRVAWSSRFGEGSGGSGGSGGADGSDGSGGVLLILDELSEFLRSKPDARSFNEDIRFLQFMGEWAQGRPFWPLAAVQEQIEHMGDLEHGSYRKIKDRYPVRLLLTPAHVKDLIGRSILVKKEGYREAVEALATRLRETFPSSPFSVEDFCALYPIHPATLELLEEVRDRFSQARGVVDFTVTQLAGDTARGVKPFLERPFGSLICPDAIVEHFQDLFEIQPEFLPLAQQVLPYYRTHLPGMFSTPALRGLAERVLKLLILTYLTPSRAGLTAREAAGWLLYKGTRLDPARNVDVVQRILATFAGQGRYVGHREDRYHLELKDDDGAALERALQRRMTELAARGEEVFEILAPLLGDEGLNPLALPREQWQNRTARWHFHDRPYAVYLGDGEPPPRDGIALCIRMPWGDAGVVPGAFTLVPGRIEPAKEHLELAALVKLRHDAPGPEAARRIQARLGDRLTLFRTQVRNAYLEATLTNPMGAAQTPPRFDASASTRDWLERLAEVMLRHTYPAFEKFAPTHGPLPTEAYRRYMRFVAEHGPGDEDSDEFVQIIREGYLVPMGLLHRKGREYAVPSRPERHELVRLVLPLLEHQPSPKLVYEHLANPVYGLVPDQVGVLLVFLHALGAVEIFKGRKSYRESCDLLPNPIQYDRIVPGRGLSDEQIRSLQQLCTGVGIQVPKGWTVPQQRRTLGRLRETARAETGRLGAFLLKIEELQRQGPLAGKLRMLLSHWGTLARSDDLLAGFAQFLYEIDSTSGFLALHGAMEKLPERIDRLLDEVKRFKHLFNKTLMEHCLDIDLVIRIEALGDAPGLDQPDELDEWLGGARTLYEQYKAEYTRRHDSWWQGLQEHSIWQWQPPAVARSRHLGLEQTLAALAEGRQRAARLRCGHLVNLDFQPVCTCGFDGDTAPVRDDLTRFEELREQVDNTLRLFFGQDAVKTRLREWAAEGLESNPGTQAYLKGDAPVPEIENLELFDQHMAGVELVKAVGIEPVVKLLGERVWARSSLVAAFDELLSRYGAARLRFGSAGADGAAASPLAAWCAEHAVRHGIPLPGGLGAGEVSEITDALRPEWIGPDSLQHLDDMALPEAAIDRIVGWILEGRVEAGRDRSGSGLLGAVQELLHPKDPGSPHELAGLAAHLYGRHARMMPVAGQRWLDRLGRLAETPLPGDTPPALVDALNDHEHAQWVLIDALGLPLLPILEETLTAIFPARKVESTAFAVVSNDTTTSGCYDEMVRAGLNHPLAKINAVDALLHGRFLPFDDLCRFAAAELQLACKKMQLDPSTPILIFADHGFRIAPDGRSYTHGGPSTLERIVPLIALSSG